MKEEIIHEFFTVTMNSVYYVTDQKDEGGTPIIENIATDAIEKRERRYLGGNLVGITKDGILLYDEECSSISNYQRRKRLQRPESVNISCWRLLTSPIVGLFLREEDAIKCFYSGDKSIADCRWKKETLDALEAIGDDHPVFILSITESINYES